MKVWIERVSETISEKVHRHYRCDNGEAGRSPYPGEIGEYVQRIGGDHHIASGGVRNLYAQPEVAKACLEKNSTPNLQHGRHHDVRHYIRQDMNQHLAHATGADRLRRDNELPFVRGQHLPGRRF